MRHKKNLIDVCRAAAAVSLVCFALAGAHATELVYVPINPMFGGNPQNGAVLLSSAQAQNKAKDPDDKSGKKATSLEQFNDSLQRAVLGRLASAATSTILGPNGQLIPGTITVGDFTITIVDLGSTLQVTTSDGVNTTVFEVSK